MITKSIEFAAKAIAEGQIVAFPTETVYGLGCNALNDEACKKIFTLKGRPNFNPLIVHVNNLHEALKCADFGKDAIILAEKFWPGPLTIVAPVKHNSNIASSVLAGLNTIALRVPSSRTALDLIRLSGKPIAAPSANKSGQISSTQINHVQKYFANDDIIILDDGSVKSEVGLESTIIDVMNLEILRDGFIDIETLSNILNKKITRSKSPAQIKAPGMMEKHYAPKTNLIINSNHANDEDICLNFGNSNLNGVFNINLSKNGDLIEASHNFYSMLHILDEYAIEHNIKNIIAAHIPAINIGIAINDKLIRASTK
jgi:L-threonylcarbamoyladenylate synthase